VLDLSGPAAVIDNRIDFGTDTFEVDPLDDAVLTEGGAEIYAEGTLGGSSVLSEVFAFEVLSRCDDAALLKSETEISYTDEGGKKTDMLVQIAGEKVGVSVTRAYHYPPTEPMSDEDAQILMLGKLVDVSASADNAAAADAWSRSVLHVMVWDEDTAQTVRSAYDSLESATIAETILVLTRTDGWDEWMY
jgi:hypothetical protein